MITSIDKARGEGNCVGATRGGKEACGCSIGVASGSIHATIARLRTETFYKAGGVDSASDSDVLLETLAARPHPDSGTHCARRAAPPNDPSWQESQRILADG